jgi:hypothetical protein
LSLDIVNCQHSLALAQRTLLSHLFMYTEPLLWTAPLTSWRNATYVKSPYLNQSLQGKGIGRKGEGKVAYPVDKCLVQQVIIGPATVGGIQAGAFKIGDTAGTLDNIIHCKLYRPGSVGFVSKSVSITVKDTAYPKP